MVVLLHGWTATADLNWFPCYERLGERYRVLAIDHRGHGRGIRTSRRFRLADCADDVAAVGEVLAIERIVPVGYSMGGPIALLTWHRHRPLVEGMVLCATAAHFRTSGAGGAFASVLPLLAGTARFAPEPARRAVASRLLGRRLDDGSFGRWAREEIGRGDPATVAEAGASLGRFDARGWLGDIDVPVAVVRTTQDTVVGPGRQHRLADSIPGAVLIDVDAGHSGCVDVADRFVPALLDGLAHVTAAPRRENRQR